ncbi:MAG: zinc ABC transporter substrate-binding protein [Ilumatobacteraceae bacterium]|nr:zinc ABC transporter substrate-binding protein [Ilumatobacteraceae bacterium]
MVLIIGSITSMKRIFPVCITLISLSACGGSSPTSEPTASRITVAASFYPIEEIVRRVGSTHVNVVALTPAGEGAHDVQLTAKQLTVLSSASAVFYISDGFQPEVEKAVASLPSSVVPVDLLQSVSLLDVVAQLDGTEGETDGEVLASGKDPHIWLDPANMVAMTTAVADSLSQLKPELATQFSTAAKSYIAELQTLGNEIDTQLATCKSRVLVTSHRAFAYLAKRANVRQVAIAGLNPEEEPSAKSLEAIARFAKSNNVGTIFFETLLPADLAKTLADKIGATADLLDPIEGISSADITAGASYISIQRDNLARLRTGLRCT